MTTRLIRQTAKEMAGAFYEQNERTEKVFRRAFPTVKDYLRGTRHRPDGSIMQVEAGWMHFVQAAKGILATSLRDKSMSEHEKERIAECLIEEAERGSRRNAQRVLQTTLDRREDNPMKFFENR